jgi:uncharacterized membrane protein YvbJ
MKSKATQKFCPNCGALSHPGDAYCLKCGYSFIDHNKKLRTKGTKWKNIIIVVVILAAAYFGIRYLNHKPIIPLNWQDAISFKNVTNK